VIQKLSNPIKPEVVTETQLHLQNEIGIERNPLLQVTSQSLKKGSEKDSMLRIVVLILNRCLIIEYINIYIVNIVLLGAGRFMVHGTVTWFVVL